MTNILSCVVCGRTPARTDARPQNALPAHVAVCQTCRDAITRREVGIVRRPDGTLYITDGRTQE